MSVLTRLVARATGAAAPALRPRLPALFEGSHTTGDPGFATESEEIPAPRSPDPEHPEAQAVGIPAAHVPGPDLGPARPHADASPADAAPRPPDARRQPPEPDQPVPPVPTRLEVTPAAEPAGRAPQQPAPHHPEAAPRVHAPSPPSAETHGEPGGRSLHDQLPDAPRPLLPPNADHLDASIPEALSAQTAPPAAYRAPAPQVPPEPDITIHIGRIDLRTAAPEPTPRRAPTRPSALPSLADYLKGTAS